MIATIAEHTVDLSLLPEEAKVMDAGCRGFLFTDEMRRMGHEVYAIDIDFLWPRQHFLCAIAGYTGTCSVKKSNDPQATQMVAGSELPCYTIEDFGKLVDIQFWDVIKLDIEGAEYPSIMALTEPPATQLSIEFHLHTGIYGDSQIKEMEDKLLSLGYFPVKHDKTSQHGCGMNYWDSLFILQK
jgi:hypothetical protein